MIVLDAGVVIAVAAAKDVFHDAATRALQEAKAQGQQLLLPMSAYSEALVWPSRQGSTARLDRFLDRTPVALAPVDRPIARAAAALRASRPRLRLPDALVLATADVLCAEALLTTDASWRHADTKVRVLEP